jgi:hypothetical protein
VIISWISGDIYVLMSCALQNSCLLITLHYIDQICTRMPLFTLSSLTCHRFIIAAIAVASKGLCDTFCTNHLYAKVGGIPVTELNMLEREFLQAIDWRLTVSNHSSFLLKAMVQQISLKG